MGRMHDWEAEMVRFARQSAAYTRANDKLAQRLLPFLPVQGHICDAGCGLGGLSLALAPLVRQVTAADISAAALAQLRLEKPKNLHIFCADLLLAQPSTPYDAMIFNLFGSPAEICAVAKKQCAGPALVIRRNRSHARFSVGTHDAGCFTFDRLCADLTALGAAFHEEIFELEMGQPFATDADAVAFFRLYSRDPSPQTIGWADIQHRLIPEPTGRYRWYLPVRNSLGLVVFDAKNL